MATPTSPSSKSNRVQKPPLGAEKNVLANGTIAIYVAGGTKPGDGYHTFVANQAKIGSKVSHIKLDFGKSSNLMVKDKIGMQVEDDIKPGECVLIADLEPQTTFRGYRLDWTVSWSNAIIDPVAAVEEVRKRLEVVTKRIKHEQQLEAKLPTSCDVPAIRQLLESQSPPVKFVDTSFPPCARSVGMPEARSRTCWRRPEEFMPPDAPPAPFKSVLSRKHVDALGKFALAAGLHVSFTVNAGWGARTASGAWESEQTRALMRYVAYCR